MKFTVEELKKRFEYAYGKAQPHFTRMKDAKNSYDNNIDSEIMPTISEIGFPFNWNAVEDQLPFAMEYLFPKTDWPRLIPVEKALDTERVEKVEHNLRYTILNEMDYRHNAYLSIKDCMRYGVGYGIVDVIDVTPPKAVDVQLAKDGKALAERREMQLGAPKKVPYYRYLHPTQVVPMPNGAQPDGPDACDHFVLRLFTEQQFRDMYKEYDTPMGKKKRFSGDAEEIIDRARRGGIDPRLSYVQILNKIKGKFRNTTGRKDQDVIVPVLVYYGRHYQCWLANGETKIREIAGEYQTIASDLVKWDAWPDGEEWFPVGPYEASEGVGTGLNIWYNGMIDLASYLMNPAKIVNKGLFGGESTPPLAPGEDYEVYGDVNQAMTFAELPAMPQQLFAMAETLKSEYGRTHSSPEAINQGGAGLVRGGTNALELLLSKTTGRQLLAATMLKSGGHQRAIEKILMKMQLLIGQGENKFVDVTYDEETGDRRHEESRLLLGI